MVLAVSGLVFALVLVLLVFIFAIPNLTSSGKVEPQLGPERFDAGAAPDRAAEIAARGSDPAARRGRQRSRHVHPASRGRPSTSGWLAFDAVRRERAATARSSGRPSGTSSSTRVTATTIDASGNGLTQYPVEVSDDGEVIVDLRSGG